MQVDGYGLGGQKDSLTKFADVSGCGGWNYSHSLLCRPDGLQLCKTQHSAFGGLS